METNNHPVVVKRLPATLTRKEARDFLAELLPQLRSDRPQLVFDLSRVHRLDAAGVDMILRCLQEASRRDGDLKLAALTPQAQVVLDLTRSTRLFEIYASATDAVGSFTAYHPAVVRQFHPVSASAAAVAEEAGGKAA